MSKTIILIGPPGSGKSSSGRALARLLDWSFLDTDSLIEERAGMSVREIFAADGEGRFRELERQVLEKMAADGAAGRLERLVIGTGGGLPVAPGNFELLAEIGPVVCLQATIDELVARLSGDSGRPLLASQGDVPGAGKKEQLSARLKALLSERSEHYGRAGHQVDTTGLDADQVAAKIVKVLGM